VQPAHGRLHAGAEYRIAADRADLQRQRRVDEGTALDVDAAPAFATIREIPGGADLVGA
jgi:hypothetical protein